MNILEFSVRKCQDFARCKAVNPTVLMLIYRFSGKVLIFNLDIIQDQNFYNVISVP